MSTFAPHFDDAGEYGLLATETVFEVKEKKYSSLLDSDGNRIPYQSKKLGFVGFFPLKERQC